MIDSNLRDTPALIYISCREPEGPKAERSEATFQPRKWFAVLAFKAFVRPLFRSNYTISLLEN